MEWFVFFHFVLWISLFFFFCTWSEGDKLYYSEAERDPSSEDNKLVNCLCCWRVFGCLSSFRGFASSHAFDLQMWFLFWSKSWLLVDLSSNFVPSLQRLICFRCSYMCSESWYFRTKTWFNNLNLIIWSCTVEHLHIQLFFSYFVIIKTSETFYKTNYGSTEIAMWTWAFGWFSNVCIGDIGNFMICSSVYIFCFEQHKNESTKRKQQQLLFQYFYSWVTFSIFYQIQIVLSPLI